MRLALRELRRRPGRFVTATLILTLVAVLVMFLGGLLDGLIRSSTDAVRAQDGDLIVYSATSQSSFLRSRIDGQTRAAVEAVPGVAETGGIGLVQLGDVATAIDSATAGATETLTITQAVDAIPGVEQQRSTFNQIIAVTVAIAVVVVALFFALLTVERLGLYGVLKAIGARSRTLFAGLVAQAVVVTTVAVVIAGGLAVLLDALIPPGSIPLDISPRRIVTSAVLLLVAAVIGCAFSLRRVLRVDPASAIGTIS
jgi:ABC-type antimicrobial peptide transport system permease subunit